MLCINKRLYGTNGADGNHRAYGSYRANRRNGSHRANGVDRSHRANRANRSYGANGANRSYGANRPDRNHRANRPNWPDRYRGSLLAAQPLFGAGGIGQQRSGNSF